MKLNLGLKVSLVVLALSLGSTSIGKIAVPAKMNQKACDFFPANKLKIPVRPTGQMSEMTFRQIVQVVSQVYSPLYRQAGRPPLYISPRWTDDNANAFAFICNQPELIGTKDYPEECAKMRTAPNTNTPFSLVVMFGGLARHPLMTVEGFILVACHEIGHHLGGFPRYDNNTSWASTEGQSDYFATAKCARKVFQAIGNNTTWLQRAGGNVLLRQTCQANFPNSAEEAAICVRSALGGLALARVLGSFATNDVNKINFTNPDRRAVAQTYEGHPEAQCRLDTYFAGSVCQIPAAQNFGPNDARTGACTPARIQHNGVRPACWFKDRI